MKKTLKRTDIPYISMIGWSEIAFSLTWFTKPFFPTRSFVIVETTRNIWT